MRVPALTSVIPGFIFAAINIVISTAVVLLSAHTLDQLDAKRAETAGSARDTGAELKVPDQEVERRFRFLSDRIPQIIWTSQPDGKVDYVNQRWFDYTGLTLEQTRGWGWKLVVRLMLGVHVRDLATVALADRHRINEFCALGVILIWVVI